MSLPACSNRSLSTPYLHPWYGGKVGYAMSSFNSFSWCIQHLTYRRTSMPRTPLGPWKLVRDRCSSSQWGLIIAPSQKHNRDIFSNFFNMKVCCVYSLESPHWGDSNEYTQYTVFNIKKKITLNYPKYAAKGFFSQGLKNEFETAVENERSVFEPLKF